MSRSSKFAPTLNRLVEMQSAPYYASAKPFLIQAEQAIVSLEGERNSLNDTLGQVIADTANELGCEHDNEAILEAISALKLQRDEMLDALKTCEGNISSLLASQHPKVYGEWLDVVRAAIAKATGVA